MAYHYGQNQTLNSYNRGNKTKATSNFKGKAAIRIQEPAKWIYDSRLQFQASTLEYRINGGGVRIIGGGWKWFNTTVIGGGVGIIGGSWRNRK